jgi:hypothetical protein
MMTKLFVRMATVVVLLAIAGWSQARPSEAEMGLAKDGVGEESSPQTIPYTPQMKVIFEEMTTVWLLSEEYARVETVCAGNGLDNINPLPDGPMVLIPNAGDLAVEGSNVSVKLMPDGVMSFIPRTQGQRIRVPMDVGSKVAGEEVLSLSLAEGKQLMALDKLIWTARDKGPYGNGHGLTGHIAECDPHYDESDYEAWVENQNK